MNNQYFFNKPETLASHILTKRPDASPIRIHKSLYLMYGYYGAFYGNLNEENSESGKTYPPELFPAKFLAWKYGPVLDALYPQAKIGVLLPHELPEGKYDASVVEFLDELLGQINEVSDFALVELVHKDKVWSSVYRDREEAPELEMNNEYIINHYSEKLFDAEE